MFVIDSSGSIRNSNVEGGDDNWVLLLQFIANVVDRLPIGPNYAQVGVVVFGNEAHNEFFLNTYKTKEPLLNHITNITHLDEKTNTSGGIRMMHKTQFTMANGARPSVPRFAIVVTDGVSTVDEIKTVPYAIDARTDNIKMFVVGITNQINDDEIREISSPPQIENVTFWMSMDFSALGKITDSIVTQTCVTDTPIPPSTTTSTTVTTTTITSPTTTVTTTTPAPSKCAIKMHSPALCDCFCFLTIQKHFAKHNYK